MNNTPALPPIECSVTSQPYPVECIEGLGLSLTLSRLSFGNLNAPNERLNVAMSLVGVNLSDGLSEYDDYPDEAINIALVVTGGSLTDQLVIYGNYPEEEFNVGLTFTGGSIDDQLIVYNNYQDEALDVALTLTSGELQ